MQIWNDALDRGPVGTTKPLLCLNCSLLSAPVYGDRSGEHRHYNRPFSQEPPGHYPLFLTQTHSSRKSIQHLTPFLTWASLVHQPCISTGFVCMCLKLILLPSPLL